MPTTRPYSKSVKPSPGKPGLRRAAATVGLACVLLALPAFSAGCEFFGYIAQAIDPPNKKVYKLKDTTTLVVVDDPNQLLGNPATSNMLAVYVGYEIEKNVTSVIIVAQDKLQELRESKGKAFDKMSLSALGKELGANQVISVYVEEAELNQDASVSRPRVMTRIKVIDADTNTRAFPPLEMPSADDPQLANRGFAVNSQMFYQAKVDESRADFTVTMQTLVKKAGADIAKLFYDHGTEAPGERFKTAS